MNTRPILAAALVAALVPATAHAGRPIDETRPLDARGMVKVENLKGSIEVRAWDRSEVKIEGVLGDGVEKLEIEGGGKRLHVRVRYPARRGLLGADRRIGPTTLRLMVPLQADLDLQAVAADVTAWGVAPGSLKIDNVSGRTTVAGAPREVEVDTVSGDVDLTVNRASVQVDSVSGNIRISGRLGPEIEVESVSGDIELRAVQTALERVEGASVSGDMRVQGALSPRARVQLESVSGDIALRLPRGTSAELRAESFSGSLRAPGATVERPRHGPGSSLRQRYGDGEAEVSIETFSGDADVRMD
ncbi:DUF4097 family beta strand repeat-containing protein [Lysobacter sp. N42]|jgi:DUF4097 and DUF4098 domain-containing protein YvlB|uniref:DUF4097 family beta strand repeat-containing protein n=1 Tax=Lysobacter sp. N42 TaxID=2545719 RepID=UPI001047DBDF|nr:DUF4097 family beta strand repeat-containing protein [Lysobacter sp. N42]TCZ77941.1 hypothetical protein EYQ95_25910 [Lysobacter sp. N42]